MLEWKESALWDGAHEVLGEFYLSVRLDGETEKRLEPVGRTAERGSDRLGGYIETAVAYRDADDTVSVRLTVRGYRDTALAFAAAETRNENGHGAQRTFAPKDALVVRAKQPRLPLRLMANYQHKDWWTRPWFGSSFAGLPERTQSLLWKDGGGYRHLLPVTGPTMKTELGGGEAASGFAGVADGESVASLAIRVSSHIGGLDRFDTLLFALSVADEPYVLPGRNAEAALDALGRPALPLSRRTYPELLDYLGWCSWDAFYHQVSEEGLLEKAAELRALGLPVRWVMIDDGWSEVRDGKLASFGADGQKFPQGLGHAIEALKERFGIRWVGVWHTIAGYWSGIDPESGIARRLGGSLYTTASGKMIPYPEAGRGFGFWHAWHGELRRQGVDFVKVDSQSAVTNFLKYERSVGEASAAAHEALEASVALHFGGTMINCMGMASENVWHRPLSAVSRSSDDFVPQEKRGFPEHALQNGYNSYYHGAFYWGDWDMFWTMNHDDLQNAVLRAVSGGPVYFSDAPGRTNPELLRPIVYRDGRIVRCDRPANPTEDCLLRDPTAEPLPLKLWNTAGGSGIVASFHIWDGQSAVEGSIGPADVPGLAAETGKYVLYDVLGRGFRIVAAEERAPLRLEAGACAIHQLTPVRPGGATPIGLADKFVPAHAIVGVREWERSLFVTLREGGELLLVCDDAPERAAANGVPAAVAAKGDGLYAVDCGACEGEVTVEIVKGGA